MMNKLAMVSLVLLFTATLLGSITANEEAVTLEGKMVCAKCNLKEEGLKTCQNVLVVENDDVRAHYYLEKNEANKEFGDVCLAEKRARVTGSVSEKEGRMWLAATEIVLIESEG
jgi:hypothetical protein